MTKQDEVLTIKEAAELLGVSEMTLRRRVDAGKLEPIPYPKALARPRRLQFRRADIERLASGS